jgi:hypothetical protein
MRYPIDAPRSYFAPGKFCRCHPIELLRIRSMPPFQDSTLFPSEAVGRCKPPDLVLLSRAALFSGSSRALLPELFLFCLVLDQMLPVCCLLIRSWTFFPVLSCLLAPIWLSYQFLLKMCRQLYNIVRMVQDIYDAVHGHICPSFRSICSATFTRFLQLGKVC